MLPIHTTLGTFCLAVVTTVTVAHGDRGGKQEAVQLLSWAEKQGGAIVSEILLGKHEINARTTYDPAVLTDLFSFLEQLSSELTTLQQTRHHVGTGRFSGHHRRDSHAQDLLLHGDPHVVLPVGYTMAELDYNNILDIIGDYTKGFVAMVQPMLLPLDSELLLSKRTASADRITSLVERIFTNIKDLKRS